jgi:hypothetical protein
MSGKSTAHASVGDRARRLHQGITGYPNPKYPEPSIIVTMVDYLSSPLAIPSESIVLWITRVIGNVHSDEQEELIRRFVSETHVRDMQSLFCDERMENYLDQIVGIFLESPATNKLRVFDFLRMVGDSLTERQELACVRRISGKKPKK